MADIKNIGFLLPNNLETATPVAGKKDAPNVNFSDILKGALKDVNDAQLEADEAVQSVMKGETKDIHDTMIALQKADVSLKMMLEVRNKIVEAYQEIIRTQV